MSRHAHALVDIERPAPAARARSASTWAACPAHRAFECTPGRPLERQTRETMEKSFAQDFSRVRIFPEGQAAESARAIGARAFTSGNRVAFAAAEYAPYTRAGRWLIAHELAHTIQQQCLGAGAGAQRASVAGRAERALEREASAAADAAVIGARAPSISAATAPAGGAILQRAPDDRPKADASPAGETPAAAASGLDVQFNAFIPGTLGKPFNSFPHPTDLKNQRAFDASLAAVPGTWLIEPGSFAGLSTGPWLYKTDNRGFGGGSHRLGLAGRVPMSAIGRFSSVRPIFEPSTTSGSEHGRWVHSGTFTSKDETGSLDGPHFKLAPAKGKEEHTDLAADASKVTADAAAAYPFEKASPDIDMKLTLDMKRLPTGKAQVRFEVENNKFPFYEVLINGSLVWTFESKDDGPGLINLNRSVSFKSGSLVF